MTPFKDRSLVANKPVYVYRNLHKGGYSVKQDGLVVAHANEVALRNCTMVVSETGRQRVVETKVKCVHAYIHGYVEDAVGAVVGSVLRYNPYVAGHFSDESGQPVHCASRCVLSNRVYFQH